MKLAPAALCAGFCAVAFSQPADTFRVNVTGTSADRGKCTVEVVVDGVAEIETSGTQARMKTLSGARSAWKRLDCNMALPKNPANFRFSAKGERGKKTLLHEPAANSGIAIVRIEDPLAGSYAYKFEFEWHGVKNGFEGGGLNTGATAPSGQGGVIDNDSLAGWNDRIEFRGTGEGYYQSPRNADSLLSDCEVLIERTSRVQVRLMTGKRDSITLTGHLVKADKNNLVANISSGAITGSMEILRDKKNQIKTLSMTGDGRNKFELRWQATK